MAKKKKDLREMDIRKVTLSIREAVDDLDADDLRLALLLGIFQGLLNRIARKLGFDFDSVTLHAKITEYTKRNTEKREEMKTNLGGLTIKEIVSSLRATVDDPNENDYELSYLLGFSNSILNRIMRKVGIDYQLPPLFPK